MNMQVSLLIFGFACASLGALTTYATITHHELMPSKSIKLITACESKLPRNQKCVLIAVKDEGNE